MDIKWTAGPGPAPLPYSKRAREAMGYSDDDKPWAHPDPPTLGSLGLGDGHASLREGRLRTMLFLIVVTIVVMMWMYRRFVVKDRNPFFAPPAPTASDQTQASEEEVALARAARLKRFEDQRASYADIMRQAAGGWTPEADSGDGVGDEAAVGAAGVESSEGLRHRGHATNNE